ncbi:MAG: hypothetical protein K8F25_14900, partial [Fimbriimonadaceae bacterium]|nr:hypothetical protein [Alphaproteobacteria bacterium]
HMYMPVSYGDPVKEYERLINGVAMWDVAVERQVQLTGPDAAALAQILTTRDLTGMKIGQGKYAPLCDHAGTLINDPVLLKLAENLFWFSIADSDILLWAKAICAERVFDVAISEPDVSPLAIQGPKARAVAGNLFGGWVNDLKYFAFREAVLEGIPLVVARSGWSKQGGFELYLRDGTKGAALWNLVKEAGRAYDIGPGAPNYVERVESGLLSFGADTDETTNPFEVGLAKQVQLDQDADFIGKAALIRIVRDGIKRRRVGLLIDGTRLTPNQHPAEILVENRCVGRMSACCYSPRRAKNIGIALIEEKWASGTTGLYVNLDGKMRSLEVTPLPFC